jgi:hypothetical protein
MTKLFGQFRWKVSLSGFQAVVGPLRNSDLLPDAAATAFERSDRRRHRGREDRESAHGRSCRDLHAEERYQVLMVFRNDFAVRLLAADPAAGFEAPIRIYVYENSDGTATISYAPPSVVFAPYTGAEVQKIAAELDPIFKAIVEQALATR